MALLNSGDSTMDAFGVKVSKRTMLKNGEAGSVHRKTFQ